MYLCSQHYHSVLHPDTRGRAVWEDSKRSVKDAIKRRFARMTGSDPHLPSSYQDIRQRLLDLVREARLQNII